MLWTLVALVGAVGCSRARPNPGANQPHAARAARFRAPPLTNGVLALPVDLKTLATAVTPWRQPHRATMSLAADGAFVSVNDGWLIVLEAATGAERWRARLTEANDYAVHPGSGCGVVVMFEPPSMTAYDLRSGAVRWRQALAPVNELTLSGDGAVVGCTVAVTLADAPRRYAAEGDTSAHVVLFDAAHGTILNEHPCTGCREIHAAERYDARSIVIEHGIPRGGTGAVMRRVVIYPDGSPELNLGKAQCVTHGYSQPVCVRVSEHSLERYSPATGALVWKTELGDAPGWHVLASNEAHLLVGTPSLPVLLDADPATGALRAAWLVSFEPRWTTLAGDTGYLIGNDEVLALDLSREAPPLRERETLAADFERSLVRLATHRGPTLVGEAYPGSSSDADWWLTRIALLMSDARIAQLAGAPPEQRAFVPTILAGDSRPRTRALVARMLAGGAMPTIELGEQRIAEVSALRAPLAPEVGNRLADATILWIEWLGALNARGWERRDPDSAIGGLESMTVAFVRESRDALERLSLDAAPANRVHAAIARLGQPAAIPQCEAAQADLAMEAALRTLLEFRPAPAHVTLPDDACVRLPAWVRRGVDSSQFGLQPTADLQWTPVGFPAIDDAERRTFTWSSSTGPLDGEGGRVVVARVRGAWRTVLVTNEWLS
jgi:hypothetical protein